MKKIIFSLVAALSLTTLAEQKNSPDIFPPIIPQNTLQQYLRFSYKYTDAACTNMKYYIDRQDAATLSAANAYTDSKSSSGDVKALSNRVVQVEGAVSTLNTTVAAMDTAYKAADTALSNNLSVAIAAAKTQADKGVADAATAQSTADAALPNNKASMVGSTAFVQAVAEKAPVTSVNGLTGAVTTRAFEEFPDSWKAVASNKTMEEFFAAVKATNPEVGRCFLGGMARMTPAPTPTLLSGNYEAVIEVPVRGVYVIKVTSTNNSPYYWFATWDLTFNGWRQVLNAETPSEPGEYTLKCVVGNTGVVMMQWVKNN